MTQYKLYVRSGFSKPDAVTHIKEDGSISSFIFDPANTDYQQYLAWLAEGHEPLPADAE